MNTNKFAINWVTIILSDELFDKHLRYPDANHENYYFYRNKSLYLTKIGYFPSKLLLGDSLMLFCCQATPVSQSKNLGVHEVCTAVKTNFRYHLSCF